MKPVIFSERGITITSEAVTGEGTFPLLDVFAYRVDFSKGYTVLISTRSGEFRVFKTDDYDLLTRVVSALSTALKKAREK